MNTEKVRILVSACITYGHVGYLKLKDRELTCLYEESLIISQYFGDILNIIQLYMLLDELKGKNCVEETSKYVNKISKLSERKEIEEMTALAFLSMAKRYQFQHKLHKGIECFKQAINISKKLGIKEVEGQAWMNLSYIYGALSEYQKMKECAENCLKIGKETRNQKLEGVGYMQLGAAYCRFFKMNEAVTSYEECINIALQIDDKELLGSTYLNLGNTYLMQRNLDKAQCYLERGQKILKQTGDRHREALTYMNLGHLHKIASEYQKATDCYQKGLSIAVETSDKYVEGSAYTNLGTIYRAQGKYHQSIKYLEKALELLKCSGDREGQEKVYIQLAFVYLYVGKFQECLENLEKRLANAMETGNKENQKVCYTNLATIHRTFKQDYEKAMEYHVKFLNCALEIGDKIGEGNAYRNIGSVHFALDNPEKAIKYFEKSLAVATLMNNQEGEANSYCCLGEAYSHLKKYDEAVRYEEKSISIATSISDKRIAGRANNILGSVHYSLSKIFDEEGDEEKCQEAKQKSEEKLKDALQCHEWEFNHLKDLYEFKITVVDTFIQTYKLLTKVLIERQKTEESLLISDRGRARSLADILVSRYGITQERAPSQAPLDNTDLQRVLSSNQFCILFFAMVDEDLYAWVLTHQKPIILINYNNQASTVVEAVKEFYLMKEMQTVRCENRSFESTDDPRLAKTSSKIPTQEPPLIQSVDRNVGSVGEPQTNVPEQKTDPLEVLFSLLVTPVMQHLQHEEIVIIPDGPLFRVPFAALKDPTTGKYLSDTKSIRISPSLTTLKALQECTVDRHSKTGALVVGDPDVGDVVLRGEKTFLSRLPSAELEAIEIGKLWDVKPLIGSQATKEMVKTKLREGVAVIHIAAHGDAEHGHIALAPPPRTHATSIPEEQDYMLTMEEVQEIGVTAQLVVLSCCHSGRGEIKAEGVVGMSRAFLAAGARAVVASLRAIDDEAALSFMINFNECLKMGESTSKSLQKAMKELQEEGYEDPKYWAPFFLIGDDVTISG